MFFRKNNIDVNIFFCFHFILYVKSGKKSVNLLLWLNFGQTFSNHRFGERAISDRAAFRRETGIVINEKKTGSVFTNSSLV